MKKFIFIFSFTLGTLFLQGQTHSILSYTFNNTLSESKGIGPALTVLGTQGVFKLDTLSEVSGKTKTVYRFEQNSGVQFNNALAGNFLDSTYSIELYFVFDALDGWKRVIDWKNRTSDYGAYVFNGELNFYPFVYSGNAPVVAGEYTYYVVTRDGLTKNLSIYTDAKVEIHFTDSFNEGVIDTSHVLNFFIDDLAAPDEASSGAVALLNLYNYVLDSTAIKHKFDSLQGQLFSVNEIGNKKNPVWIYPNPAGEIVNINLSQFIPGGQVNVSLINSTGTVVYNRPYPAGSSYRIDLNSLTLPNGIYMAKAESATELYYQKFIIRR
jgi:OmpA-OmpF porin, OOP family